jgi:tetratricopeptide (TPR) repeat protein
VGLLSLQFVERQNFTFALPVEWISELSNRTQPVPIGADKGELDELNRAMVLEKKSDGQALLKLSQQEVKRDPANAAAWYSVGVAFAHLKQYSQAVQAYREAIRNQAEYDEAWHKLGVAYANLKEYDHAIHAYRDAVHIRKENAETWYAWAILTMNLSSMPTPFMPIGRHCTYSRRILVPGIAWALPTTL